MKNPRKKRIICVLTALALLIALGAAYAAYGFMTDTSDTEDQIRKNLKSISSSLTHVFQSDMAINDNYNKMLLKKAMLSALPLRDLVRQEGDDAIRSYERGCVLRVDQNAVAMPQGMPFETLDVQYFKNPAGALCESGRFDLDLQADGDAEYLCAFQRITGDYYYLDYTLAEARDEYMDAYLNSQSILENLDRAFNGRILLYAPSGNRHELLYASESFAEYTALEDMGIDPDLPAQSFATVTLGNTRYFYTLSDPVMTIDGTQSHAVRAAFLIPFGNLTVRQYPRLAMALGVAALFFIVTITWVLSVCSLVRRSIIPEAQRHQYSVARVRKVTVVLGVAGALTVLLMTMFIDALLMLYRTTQNNQALLETMNAVVSQATEDEQLIKAQEEDAYVRYAQRVADLLAANPELHNKAALQEICDVIGVDYIMLYDDSGRETLSNAPYVNLSLNANTSAGLDFRRLLTGVPSIVHEARVDEATDLYRQLIGVCMKDGDLSDGYGALILARIPPDGSNAMSIDELMSTMTPEHSLCLIMDPESGDIQHASVPDYVGGNALTLGMPRRALQDNFMDYFRLDGPRWYSCSFQYGDGLYHCATLASDIFRWLPRNALVFALLFLAAYALLAVALLCDYTEKAFDEFAGKAVAGGESPAELKDASQGDPYERFSAAFRDLHILHTHKPPEKRAWFAFRLTGSIMLIAALLIMQYRMNNRVGTMNASYILSYVMGGSWERGINLFAVARILMLFASVAVLLTVIGLVADVLCRVMAKRGETFCRLICSLIQYGSILALLFASFNYLGFDTNALLASVGLLSLAVSLGAKDLVADVLSGVSIAVSDEYQIGDYIEVNGFRGWVLEIGVRSTTLINSDGNIKNMSNRDVKNVLNLSRRNSRYTINITIAYDQSLQQVEEILDRELPKIGEGIKEILNGPTYRGVTNIGNGGMTLAISAECKEHHYGRVRSRLNREIRLMLEKNGIAIK